MNSPLGDHGCHFARKTGRKLMLLISSKDQHPHYIQFPSYSKNIGEAGSVRGMILQPSEL